MFSTSELAAGIFENVRGQPPITFNQSPGPAGPDDDDRRAASMGGFTRHRGASAAGPSDCENNSADDTWKRSSAASTPIIDNWASAPTR
jgi:hypothetical protein